MVRDIISIQLKWSFELQVLLHKAYSRRCW